MTIIYLTIYQYIFLMYQDIFYFRILQTDINSIQSRPNMRYSEMPGRVFKRKEDYVNSIVRACARKFFGTCIFQILPVKFHLQSLVEVYDSLVCSCTRKVGFLDIWYSVFSCFPLIFIVRFLFLIIKFDYLVPVLSFMYSYPVK